MGPYRPQREASPPAQPWGSFSSLSSPSGATLDFSVSICHPLAGALCLHCFPNSAIPSTSSPAPVPGGGAGDLQLESASRVLPGSEPLALGQVAQPLGDSVSSWGRLLSLLVTQFPHVENEISSTYLVGVLRTKQVNVHKAFRTKPVRVISYRNRPGIVRELELEIVAAPWSEGQGERGLAQTQTVREQSQPGVPQGLNAQTSSFSPSSLLYRTRGPTEAIQRG